MKTEATPRPWRQGKLLMTRSVRTWSPADKEEADSRERKRVFAFFRDEDEGKSRISVAECYDEKDAELIVKAVNAYDALVAENKRLEQVTKVKDELYYKCEQLQAEKVELLEALNETTAIIYTMISDWTPDAENYELLKSIINSNTTLLAKHDKS